MNNNLDGLTKDELNKILEGLQNQLQFYRNEETKLNDQLIANNNNTKIIQQEYDMVSKKNKSYRLFSEISNRIDDVELLSKDELELITENLQDLDCFRGYNISWYQLEELIKFIIRIKQRYYWKLIKFDAVGKKDVAYMNYNYTFEDNDKNKIYILHNER